MMAWPGAQLAIPQSAQLTTQRLPGDADLKLFPQPLAEIDQAPAHHTVDSRDRTTLDDGHQRLPMRVGQPWRRSRSLAVDQAIRSLGIEPQHPVSNDLQPDIADMRRLAATATVVGRRQGKQSPGLLRILRPSRQSSQIGTREVRPKRYRCCHGGHPHCPPS